MQNQKKAKQVVSNEDREARQKKNQDVIQSGRDAYKILVPINNNPYSKQPNRDLWEKGYRLERRKDEAKRFPEKFQNQPAKPFVKPTFRPRPAGNNRPTPRPVPAPKVEQSEKPVLSTSMIERFNRRYHKG